VTVANPAIGLWKALVDPFAIPAGSTSYTYSDSLSNPAYGSVTVPANPGSRASGATWPINATGTANTSAGTGRFLRASVSVREAASGATLGSATVLFNNVTP
jgi:hypothetical protein